MGILGPHHSHPFIGFHNEFKIGDIFSTKPKISGLGIHPSLCSSAKCKMQSEKFFN